MYKFTWYLFHLQNYTVVKVSLTVYTFAYACQTGSKCRKVIYICRVSIFMSKSDKDMSSFPYLCRKERQIEIYMSKLQYIYPNCIYIQIVIYIQNVNRYIYIQVLCPLSVLYTTLYTSSHIAYSSMYMYMSRSFSIYIVFCGN